MNNGAYIYWIWGDQEIENPGILRQQLMEMQTKGFSGVLTTLRSGRYEFLDRTVLRTVSKVSQWSKKRSMAFWFQADPRQASRTIITRTGERLDVLLLWKSETAGGAQPVHAVQVRNNHFELRFIMPQKQFTSMLLEGTLCFEPVALERAFLFQMENGLIIKDTVRDITPECHFYTNLIEGYSEVFGDVRVPEQEEWFVTAFPRFSTNQVDFAGRESKDMMLSYVEDLFDACTHLDGISWGEGGGGYIVRQGYFPVSLALYNSFLAQYRYDVRDYLFTLVFDVDDRSHIRVRSDYFSLLMETVTNAIHEFYQMIHSFFSGIDISLHHHWHQESTYYDNLLQGNLDPWRNLGKTGSALTEIGREDDLKKSLPLILAALQVTKSLGVFSGTKKAFFSLKGAHYTGRELQYWSDILGLLSIRCVTQATGSIRTHFQITEKQSELPFHQAWDHFDEVNRRFNDIHAVTGYRFPDADTALVFPMETVMASDPRKADLIATSVVQLIHRLFTSHVQFDVITSGIWKNGKLGPDGFVIDGRVYKSLIYPYPEVMDEEVLESAALMQKFGFPLIMGGPRPAFLTTGKRIPRMFRVSFHPEDDDLAPLWKEGIATLFTPPENCLSACISDGPKKLFLFCPDRYEGTYQGTCRWQKMEFPVPKADGLTIFEVSKGKADQVLGAFASQG